MEVLALDWGKMHLATSKGDGPSLVFINSLGTDLRMWDAVLAQLPQGWASLRMDKRGHGLSDTAEMGYSITDLAQDVLMAMDSAQIDTAIIVGCSIGGLIAQHIALLAPTRVQALVLSNTASMLGAAEGWQSRISAVKASGMADMAGQILPRWFGPAMLARTEAALWQNMLARTDEDGYCATCAAIAGTDVTAELGKITQPALVFAGAHDLATPPEMVKALAQALPSAELITFDDTGHLPAVESPQAFAAALVEFVERTLK